MVGSEEQERPLLYKRQGVGNPSHFQPPPCAGPQPCTSLSVGNYSGGMRRNISRSLSHGITIDRTSLKFSTPNHAFYPPIGQLIHRYRSHYNLGYLDVVQGPLYPLRISEHSKIGYTYISRHTMTRGLYNKMGTMISSAFRLRKLYSN